jgi:hypothetical protein
MRFIPVHLSLAGDRLAPEAEPCPFLVLIDFIVGPNFEQENIVFWLTCTFDKIKDDAEIVSDTARP